MLLDHRVVELVVIRGEEYQVVARNALWRQRHAAQIEMVLAHFGERRYVRIGVVDARALGRQ